MTCKECLHFEVCNRFGMISGVYAGEVCEGFFDKTEWVHLPCKVGDTVYCFAPCFDEKRQPKLQVTETKVVDIKTIATVYGMEFDVGKIGKTVFLTREEATEYWNRRTDNAELH